MACSARFVGYSGEHSRESAPAHSPSPQKQEVDRFFHSCAAVPSREEHKLECAAVEYHGTFVLVARSLSVCVLVRPASLSLSSRKQQAFLSATRVSHTLSGPCPSSHSILEAQDLFNNLLFLSRACKTVLVVLAPKKKYFLASTAPPLCTAVVVIHAVYSKRIEPSIPQAPASLGPNVLF